MKQEEGKLIEDAELDCLGLHMLVRLERRGAILKHFGQAER